ncbi:Arm DNA-binding domain-containing protein [Candidimonas nitroreducens]|uniref:Arm DNA-binding domain-containing protein n=1 Tax=Candidimonas nitroreducens TaxID=683354 RepID=UPI0011773733|nr:Arm DNA-binding domain-containing protein [Candidimonas nitroreducens]
MASPLLPLWQAREGKASWVYDIASGGQNKEKVLGRFPDVSLKNARELARQDRAKIQHFCAHGESWRSDCR